ncbi:MAG: histidine phosphatase family protein [Spirochaetaceae bacterium]|nr:histidine phosphatase family protein [Spirochaetaceae bacterium]
MNQFPSIRLFLVRHAQARNAPGTSYDDASLSVLGRSQAAAAAHACAELGPDALYASPATRARETADRVGAATGLPVTVDERLLEYRFGSVTDPNLTMDQLRERRDDLLAWHPDRKLAADGETIREFAERVMAVTDEIVARHVGERVAVVSHAGTIDVTMRWAIGIAPGTPVLHDFPIANASISELIHWPHGRMTGGAPRYTEFASVGSVDHLPFDVRSGN